MGEEDKIKTDPVPSVLQGPLHRSKDFPLEKVQGRESRWAVFLCSEPGCAVTNPPVCSPALWASCLGTKAAGPPQGVTVSIVAPLGWSPWLGPYSTHEASEGCGLPALPKLRCLAVLSL